MADDKKKEAPSSSPSTEVLWYLIIVIPLIIILFSALSGESINKTSTTGNTTPATASTTSSTGTSLLSPLNWSGRDTLRLGQPIINKKEVPVRTAPAGSIIGRQDKLETGRLMEGPLEQFGTIWWRVDYPNAPDGWVEFSGLSSKVGTVRALNIVPLLYSFYQPIGYGLVILMLIIYIVFRLKLSKEEKIAERKQQLKAEQYMEPQVPLAQQIADKPDVQELPGFQTEEIVPVKVAEENARWTHIQGLIASYNPSDWRQAIIEADIILEEMLEKMAYPGVTIGDKLKNVERSDFLTLDKAWSAHKVRNQIAHGGSTFKLSRELAERTIKEYEEVFREFYYI